MSRHDRVSVGEFALAFSLRDGGRHWAVLLAPDASLCSALATELAHELSALVDVPVEVVTPSGSLIEALCHAGAPVLVVASPSGGELVAWGAVDRDRNRLPADRRVAVVLSESAFDALQRDAPNLASWVGGNVAHADIEADLLTAEQRAEVLRRLREKYALADDELIARALRGEAPAEPDVAVWLVLLGRGDLL